MKEVRRVVRVFLGSPGDLAPERLLAKSVCDEFNALWGAQLGYLVELVGWEDTAATYGRAQEVINRDLRTCEMFIGMVWKRWGTPPAKDGPFNSGFEEEYSLAIERRDAGEPIEICLLFKNVDEEALRDPGDQLKLVMKFKARLEEEKRVFYEGFSENSDFATKFRKIVTRYVQRVSQTTNDSSIKEQSRSSEVENDSDRNERQRGAKSLPEEIESFLTGFLDASRSHDFEVSAIDAARHRLVATTFYTPQNDRIHVQSHDANIIYARKDDLTLSVREKGGLLAAGLRRFSDENTPIWHWYVQLNSGQEVNALVFYSAYARSKLERVGALRALRVLGLPFKSEDQMMSAACKRWFEASGDIRTAALDYLGDFGDKASAQWIRSEYEKADGSTQSSALDALVRLTSRESPEEALKTLFELQPFSVSLRPVITLFDHLDGVATNIVILGLNQRAADIRRATAKVLFKRAAIDEEMARRLISDEDVEVRYLGSCALARLGHPLSEVELKAALKKNNAGILFIKANNEDEWLQRYNNYLYSIMDIPSLEKAVESESLFHTSAFEALARRRFHENQGLIRSRLADRYRTVFAEHIESWKSSNFPPDLIEKTERLRDFTTGQQTSTSLEVILEKSAAVDLPLVREILSEPEYKASALAFQYFRKNGTWEDVSLISTLAERGPEYSMGFEFSDIQKNCHSAAGKALLSIGRDRLPDLLEATTGGKVLPYVIAGMPKVEFSKLADFKIIDLLRDKSDDLRKCVSLKCAASLPVSRVKALLERYIKDGDEYFYNAVVWLDMKASVGKHAESCANRILKSLWI